MLSVKYEGEGKHHHRSSTSCRLQCHMIRWSCGLYAWILEGLIREDIVGEETWAVLMVAVSGDAKVIAQASLNQRVISGKWLWPFVISVGTNKFSRWDVFYWSFAWPSFLFSWQFLFSGNFFPATRRKKANVDSKGKNFRPNVYYLPLHTDCSVEKERSISRSWSSIFLFMRELALAHFV